MYVFRYQYLLIEVGTVVLRKVFDNIVSDDFMRYLNAHPTHYNQLQYLLDRDIISDTQKCFLPPNNTKPVSSNFDISLLALILRNVCGLRYRRDTVWLNPTVGDMSIEADITRLRICRNNLQHRGIMFISEAEFTAKWTELCQVALANQIAAFGQRFIAAILLDNLDIRQAKINILHRLNNVGGIPEIQSIINEAEHMALDETLKEQLNKKMKEWDDSDRLTAQRIEEVKSEVTAVKHDLVGIMKNMKTVMSEVTTVKQDVDALTEKEPHDELSDLKHHLLETYNRDCCTLPLSALCTEEEEDFFQVYKTPTMHHVDYHRAEITPENTSISSYRDIFVKEDQCFQNIYVTGDAGVGKTSLCKCLCLLWCKSQTGGTTEDENVEDDINFLASFEFVFCLSLKDTECRDAVSMIAEQFFDSDCKEVRTSIEHVLKHHKCLVIFDALDEWMPKVRGKRECRLPLRVHSDTCVYLTTCRPYKIENVRLARREIDQQVRISGIHGKSSEVFILEVVKHLNKENGVEKSAEDFKRDVAKCGLGEQLCTPMIASHLVVVWFEQKLTDMSKALLCGKILELLFTRAKQKNVKSPALPTSEVQLPGILAKLRHLKEHVSLLRKLCLLSFRSLFKQDENALSLVFTREQLRSEPYLICDEEMDFLCKIGILSKNKVIGCFEYYKLKLSFLHKSYMEFFAALFVSSFDTKNVLDNVAKAWIYVNDVVQFQNFFLLLSGMSYPKVKRLFDNIYMTISDDLALCRRNEIFHYYPCSYMEQIKLLQTILINCWKESGRINDPTNGLQLQDFIFDDLSNVDALEHLLLPNESFVKSLHSVNGRYFGSFNQLKHLQCLHVGKIEPGHYTHFNECMLQNKATLHTVCVEGNHDTKPLLPELPLIIYYHHLARVSPTIRTPHSGCLIQLTSLSLSDVKMQHDSLHNLVVFLSNNVLMENIFLRSVYCDNHHEGDNECTSTLTLQQHTKLTTLCLWNVNTVCRNVNTSCLKCIALRPFSMGIVRCYNDVFHSIKHSQLECLRINGHYLLDCNTVDTIISTVETLPRIKFLSLRHLVLPRYVSLQLHPHVQQVEIRLTNITMSRHYFHSCIKDVVNNQSVKEAELNECIITTADREMNAKESFDYMSKNFTPKPSLRITYKDKYKDQYLDGYVLWSKTKRCQ